MKRSGPPQRKTPLQRKTAIRPSAAPERDATAKPKKRRAGLKITKEDREWSRQVRERDSWTCQWEGCGKRYDPPTKALQGAHLFSRGKHTTKLILEAGVALCYGHHRYADSNAEGRRMLEALGRKKLGDDRYEALKVLSETPLKTVRRGIDLTGWTLIGLSPNGSTAAPKPAESPGSRTDSSTTGPRSGSSGRTGITPDQAIPVAGTGWRSS